jgi:hypothetical protein
MSIVAESEKGSGSQQAENGAIKLHHNLSPLAKYHLVVTNAVARLASANASMPPGLGPWLSSAV